ncbi:choice-of-anchor I family protein [Ulvibacterium marinum]|uniref:Alkaline phosphatase n=1 Tax=Ulvibacterium marinum TaxID=2419782 RepID=A0A3B0CF85_9FLAO|nr:choice-of-anchor I family protein [Ulvibacterium marinum]RKN83558.1 alkaline phosphatase [Ulvibacterium marinum]
MKLFTRILSLGLLFSILSCDKLDDFLGDPDGHDDDDPTMDVNFVYKNTIQVGGEGAAEISAYDPMTKKLFTVNVETNGISVYDISDLDAPMQLTSIDLSGSGAPNSVAVKNGILAVAVEAEVKQDQGAIKLFDTETQNYLNSFTVGALPDMVAFSPDGKYIVSANEGEPNDDYTNDPHGTVSIINVAEGAVETLDFESFNMDVHNLCAEGFRVFGPGATLAMDVEPEYVAISEDSKTAWVTLQENNGVAVVNLETKQIEAILPLGFKDYSLPGNEIDPSNEDGKKELRSVPVFGIFQPDAIAHYNVSGADYIITANEGDARDYDGFSEEERIGGLPLDETKFPDAATLQLEENLGRLQSTTTLGDIDGDGDYDELYNYGARSFTIWTGNGQLVYDSGNDIAMQTLSLTPDVFNGDDARSDDKGAEPEAVEVLKVGEKYILFVGLERNNQVMIYDISDPYAPVFMDILSNAGDIGPEGVLAIPAEYSPSGKDVLVVSNEVSGTVTFYEN